MFIVPALEFAWTGRRALSDAANLERRELEQVLDESIDAAVASAAKHGGGLSNAEARELRGVGTRA